MGKRRRPRSFLEEINELFEVKHRTFLVLNDDAQFYSGLRGGQPMFSESYDDARPLYRHSQFKTLQRITYHNLYKEYIEN